MKSLTQHINEHLINESLGIKPSKKLEYVLKLWIKNSKSNFSYEDCIKDYNLFKQFEDSKECEELEGPKYDLYEEYDELLSELRHQFDQSEKSRKKEDAKIAKKNQNEIIKSLTSEIKSSKIFDQLYEISDSEKSEDRKKWSSLVEKFNNIICKKLPNLKEFNEYFKKEGGIFYVINFSGSGNSREIELDGIGSGNSDHDVSIKSFTNGIFDDLKTYITVRRKFYTGEDWIN